MFIFTSDAAQQSQCGRVTRVLIDHAAGGRLRQRDGQGDRAMKLSASRLDGADGRDCNAIAQQFSDQLTRNWLGLGARGKIK